MTQQERLDFYKAKFTLYRKRYPNRTPSRRTIRQWVREANERSEVKGGKVAC